MTLPRRSGTFGLNLTACVTLAATLCLPTRLRAQSEPGHSEEAIETLPVFSRPHDQYDPSGIRTNSFQLYPALQLSEQYDTNLYAQTSRPVSDSRTLISPSFSAQSDWNRNALGFSASADIFRQNRRVSENITNTQTALSGRWDLRDESFVQSTTKYQIQHENRGSPDAVNGKSPTRFDLTSESLSYKQQSSSVGLQMDLNLVDYKFHNVESSAGGIINQTNRNRTEYSLAPTISYSISPTYQLFATAGGNVRSYDSKQDANGFDRSASGYQISAGTGVDLTGLLYGSFYLGYQNEVYRDSRLPSASGLAFGSNLLWNPTRITSVTLKAARVVSETTINNASSALETDASLEVQHELRRNLLVKLSGGYSHLDYQGIQAGDDFYQAGGEVRYLLNEHASAGATASYQMRPSGSLTAGFSRAIFGVQITAQF